MPSHPIVHIEFSSKDLAAAGKFYGQLFDWEVEHIPEMNYATFNPGEGPGGGFSPVSDSYPPGTVVVYIGVDDIDATLAQIEAMGGKTVTTKTEIPGMGWFGLFSDPTGNLVGLYTVMPGMGT